MERGRLRRLQQQLAAAASGSAEGMTAHLSFPERQRHVPGIEHFYTDLHRAMYDLGSIADAPFPTAREFRAFVDAEYPGGMSGLRCLDVGCGGTAVNARTLTSRGARVFAVDINLRSLRLVGGASPPVTDALSLACGSALQLPLPSATFDFVICSGVVHHTPDPECALRELRRVMKPAARLYVSVYCFEGSVMLSVVKLWRLAARVVPFSLMHRVARRSVVLNDFVLDHMYVPVLWVYRSSDFSTLLARSGLEIERTFVSAVDRFHSRRLARWSLTGDGLLRVFVCRPEGA